MAGTLQSACVLVAISAMGLQLMQGRCRCPPLGCCAVLQQRLWMALWLSGCALVRRLAAFDNVRQVQVAGLLVHRPASANDFQAPDSRSK